MPAARQRFLAGVLAGAMAWIPAARLHAREGESGAPAVAPNAEARELYEQALRHYDVGQLEEAIAKFKRAYFLSNKPELLFNLAQACRANQDPAQAAHLYRTFLALRPDAPNRPVVEAALAEVEAQLKAAAAAHSPVAPEVVPPPAALSPAVLTVSPAPVERAPSFVRDPCQRSIYWRPVRMESYSL